MDSIGRLLFLTDVPSRFESHVARPNYYCVGMIARGGLKITISPNSLMVYRPGQTFKVEAIEKGTQGTFVLFTRKFPAYLNENIFSVRNKSFLSSGISSVFELEQQDRVRVASLFKDIFYLLKSWSKGSWELIAGYIPLKK